MPAPLPKIDVNDSLAKMGGETQYNFMMSWIQAKHPEIRVASVHDLADASKSLGYASITDAYKAIVIDYQTKLGVTPDGNFGPKTLATYKERGGSIANIKGDTKFVEVAEPTATAQPDYSQNVIEEPGHYVRNPGGRNYGDVTLGATKNRGTCPDGFSLGLDAWHESGPTNEYGARNIIGGGVLLDPIKGKIGFNAGVGKVGSHLEDKGNNHYVAEALQLGLVAGVTVGDGPHVGVYANGKNTKIDLNKPDDKAVGGAVAGRGGVGVDFRHGGVYGGVGATIISPTKVKTENRLLGGRDENGEKFEKTTFSVIAAGVDAGITAGIPTAQARITAGKVGIREIVFHADGQTELGTKRGAVSLGGVVTAGAALPGLGLRFGKDGFRGENIPHRIKNMMEDIGNHSAELSFGDVDSRIKISKESVRNFKFSKAIEIIGEENLPRYQKGFLKGRYTDESLERIASLANSIEITSARLDLELNPEKTGNHANMIVDVGVQGGLVVDYKVGTKKKSTTTHIDTEIEVRDVGLLFAAPCKKGTTQQDGGKKPTPTPTPNPEVPTEPAPSVKPGAQVFAPVQEASPANLMELKAPPVFNGVVTPKELQA